MYMQDVTRFFALYGGGRGLFSSGLFFYADESCVDVLAALGLAAVDCDGVGAFCEYLYCVGLLWDVGTTVVTTGGGR